MARARDENNRLPSSGPDVRYVRFDSTDDDPDQPVQVKYLKWDDDDEVFETYGEAFRIGDSSGIVGSGDFWIVWKSDALRWMPLGGAGGKRTSLLIATNTIPAAAGGFPGDSSDFSIEDGDDPNGVIYNWSGETIGSGSYMVTIQIGDRDVIVQAFCPMIV